MGHESQSMDLVVFFIFIFILFFWLFFLNWENTSTLLPKNAGGKDLAFRS